MSHHAMPEQRGTVIGAEPVGVAEIVRLVVAALVALGWITLDAVIVEVIISAVGAVLSLALTVWARQRVTPATGPAVVTGPPNEPL